MPPINEPILIDTKNYLLHPFRAEDMKRLDSLSKDIHQLFAEDNPHQFLPHKKIANAEQAGALLQIALINQLNGMRQIYFITDKHNQKTVGMLELIHPKNAKEFYTLVKYPHILEFCLSKEYVGKGIMSKVLPAFVQCLKRKGIQHIGAVVNPRNLKAIKVLQKSGIYKQSHFDSVSHLYHN